MASRRPSFLSQAKRAELLRELETNTSARSGNGQLKKNRNVSNNNNSNNNNNPAQQQQKKKEDQEEDGGDGTPCLVCLEDRDYANLLICDKCDGHYHTHCLAVPLKSVPEEDWFCDACIHAQGDGLEHLVSGLPPSYTSRFGEICWAQGGVGYGWWPACIYDPRLTAPRTRLHARKHVGTKHLLYFFQCDETPFDLIPMNKLLTWEEGMAEGFHLGSTAKAAGKKRFLRFQEALQAAIIEDGKPIARRLDWTHNEGQQHQPRLLPSPIQITAARKVSLGKRARARSKSSRNGRQKRTHAKRTLNFGGGKKESPPGPGLVANDHRIETRPVDYNRVSAPSFSSAPPLAMETNDDEDELYCQIYLTDQQGQPGTCVGFIMLPSSKSTFADTRTVIMETLETEKFPSVWRFLHPLLGPVSIKLETKTGSMLSYLRKGPKGKEVGDGSLENPAKVTIMADPLSTTNASPSS